MMVDFFTHVWKQGIFDAVVFCSIHLQKPMFYNFGGLRVWVCVYVWVCVCVCMHVCTVYAYMHVGVFPSKHACACLCKLCSCTFHRPSQFFHSLCQFHNYVEIEVRSWEELHWEITCKTVVNLFFPYFWLIDTLKVSSCVPANQWGDYVNLNLILQYM